MSLTIAIKAIDGLVLAADSRTTAGYTLDGPKTRDNSIKLIQLNDNFGVLTYGLSDIGYTGVTSLRKKISRDNNPYTPLASILDIGRQVFKKVSSGWDQRNPEIKRRDKDVGFILAGYERGEKEFKIINFQSPDFLPASVKSACFLAGQWHIAKFFIKRLYTRDMTIDLLKELAVFLLNATMTVEKTVGGAIRLAIINKSKGFQWVSEEKVNFITKKNKSFGNFFQERFYSSLLNVVDNNRKKISSGEVKRCQMTSII